MRESIKTLHINLIDISYQFIYFIYIHTIEFNVSLNESSTAGIYRRP